MTDLSTTSAHGGTLVNLVVESDRTRLLQQEAQSLACWDLTQRQVCDIELLMNGAFSPLTGFMDRATYDNVCKDMRLGDGTLWPIPITLDVTSDFAQEISIGSRIALRHPEGIVLAILEVSDVWQPDRQAEAYAVFGTDDPTHPGVFALLEQHNATYLGGRIQGIELPPQHTFLSLRHTPAQLRERFASRGKERVVAFQTRNPMHRAHIELTRLAAERTGAHLLIHPVVGMTKPGDIDYFIRVRAYEAMLPYYESESVDLSLLPLAMRMAGPREAVWHAIIRKNHGCTHFIVGRDHAGPGNDATGRPFYGPYDAQELIRLHRDELGIDIVDFQEMVYVLEDDCYQPVTNIGEGKTILSLSGTEIRDKLAAGEDIPEWFSYPEVARILRDAYPPKSQQGFTVFFTGLPSSGKSTIANVLISRLMELTPRPVTLLDGDIVRKHLSSELGFSKEHRNLNIQRIGYVASEITKHRGIAVCAPIAPYGAVRREVREMVGTYGGFVEVYVSTPLDVCEQRDRKGLYAKARAGQIAGFTGIDDPYEVPENPELSIDTTTIDPLTAVERVISHLKTVGYLPDDSRAGG